MNPLDQQKFDALINWHNEHTVLDKATEAEGFRAPAYIGQIEKGCARASGHPGRAAPLHQPDGAGKGGGRHSRTRIPR